MPATDPAIDKQVQEEYAAHGIGWLQQAVMEEDIDFYLQGEVQNPARMMRALAFVRTTGRSIVHYRTQTKKQRPFNIIKVGLELPREKLYDRINKRVDIMMAAGLLAEVTALLPYKESKNLQTVGYAELFEYLDGKCTLQEATDKIKQHSRNYAKRQMTWFKKDTDMHWLSADDERLVEKILALK